jgi:hypothetical protein
MFNCQIQRSSKWMPCDFGEFGTDTLSLSLSLSLSLTHSPTLCHTNLFRFGDRYAIGEETRGRRYAGDSDLRKGVVRVSRMCSVRVCLCFLMRGLPRASRTFSHFVFVVTITLGPPAGHSFFSFVLGLGAMVAPPTVWIDAIPSKLVAVRGKT